jgi:hypothetical protein
MASFAMADPKDAADEDPKPEWRFEAHPREYRPLKKRRTPSWASPRRSVITLDSADRRYADPQPDPRSPNITGRYQSHSAAGLTDDGPPILLHVNQAGKCVEGLFTFLPVTSERTIRHQRFGGNLTTRGSFWIYGHPFPDAGDGSIRAVDADNVVVTFPGAGEETPFRLRERRPSFLDDSMQPVLDTAGAAGASPQQGELIERRETSPLSDAQKAECERLFAPEKLKPFLDRFYSRSSSSQAVVQAERLFAIRGSRLEMGLEDYLADANARMGRPIRELGFGLSQNQRRGEDSDPRRVRWSDEQIPLAYEYVRVMLASAKVTYNGTTKSLLQHIETAAGEVIGATTIRAELPNVRALLGWGPAGTALTMYKYTVEVDLEYKDRKFLKLGMPDHEDLPKWLRGKQLFALGGGLYYGTIAITCVSPVKWIQTYDVALAGPGFQLGYGSRKGLKGGGLFETPSEWTAADFLGYMQLFEGGSWAKQDFKVAGFAKGVRDPVLRCPPVWPTRVNETRRA